MLERQETSDSNIDITLIMTVNSQAKKLFPLNFGGHRLDGIMVRTKS